MKIGRIGLFMFILIAVSIASYAINWPQTGGSGQNLHHVDYTMNGMFPTNLQNITAGDLSLNDSYKNPPITYDFSGDGNPELMINDLGILKFFSKNSTNQFQISDSYILDGIPSTAMYVNVAGSKRQIIYSSESTLYVMDFSLYPIITLAGSKPLSNPNVFRVPSGSYYNPNSVKCYSDWCVLKEDGANIEIFNVSNPSAITSINFTNPNIYNGSMLYGYVPLINENDPTLPKVVVFCQNGSSYGLEQHYLKNASLYSRNCNAASVIPNFDPFQVDWDGDNLNELLFFSSDGNQQNIYSLNLLMNLQANFPFTGPAGANYDKGFGLYQGQIFQIRHNTAASNTDYVRKFTTVGGSAGDIVLSPNSLGVNDDSIIIGNDFFITDKVYYDGHNNKYYNLTSSGGSNAIASYSDGSVYLFQSNAGGINVHRFGAVPPWSVNATVYTTLNGVNIDICPIAINTTTGVSYGFLGVQNGPGLGCNFRFAVTNITVNMTAGGSNGILAYNEAFTLMNGNNAYNVTLSLNTTTGVPDYVVYLLDMKTGDPILSGGSANMVGNDNNRSYAFSFVDGVSLNNNIIYGNYTLSASAPGYSAYTRDVLIYPFLPDAGSTAAYLTPLGYSYTGIPQIQQATAWTAIPKSIEMARFNLGAPTAASILGGAGSVFGGGSTGVSFSLNKYEMITSPSTICINQTIIVNYTAFKSDNESFNVEFSCDGINQQDATSDIIKKISGNDATWVNGVVGCTWFGNDTGAKTIKLWARSPTYNYGINNFQSLLDSGLAYQYNVSVGGASCEQQAGVALSSSDSAQFHLMLGVIIWILSSIVVAAFISALISGGPLVFGIVAGGVGIAVSIILALPMIGWLPPYFTLVLTIFDAAAIAVSVRMGMTG